MKSSTINSSQSQNELNSIQKELLKIHLPYEIDMLMYSIEMLKNQTDINGRLSLIGLMSFECFFLHARNLREFFKRTDDVVPIKRDKPADKDSNGSASAGSFTDEKFTKERKYNSQQASFQRLNTLIDHQITHLQYSRGENAEYILKGSDVQDIFNALIKDIKLFESNLKPEAEKVWEKREIKKLDDISISFINSATNAIQSTTSVYSNALDSAGDILIHNIPETISDFQKDRIK